MCEKSAWDIEIGQARGILVKPMGKERWWWGEEKVWGSKPTVEGGRPQSGKGEKSGVTNGEREGKLTVYKTNPPLHPSKEHLETVENLQQMACNTSLALRVNWTWNYSCCINLFTLHVIIIRCLSHPAYKTTSPLHSSENSISKLWWMVTVAWDALYNTTL
jgi:hypothetical protein